MLIQRLQPPLRASLTSIARSGASNSHAGLNEAFAALRLCQKETQGGNLNFVRYATHKAQGAVNKAKDGPGKRLGCKKSGEQYVIPGNIIFRQRGTHWFPGDNCAMGRDHTIYATESGYVKYYKDPERHPKRQYIGVVFERNQVLPLPRNSMRRRRLGLAASQMEFSTVAETPEVVEESAGVQTEGDVVQTQVSAPAPAKKVRERKGEEGRVLTLRPGYMYREANWEIGRAAERAKIQVREFKPRDRWTAWKKSTVRKAANVGKRSLKGAKAKKSRK
ncbi:hypothetical protein V494_05916 [Pseudogymnoascus sp. VKM F-4513 (FW-928)]|nr:hypothetical protein V494_05916 [Pseudogymnoascus sp. VKM F-4513 (FW-928)]